MRLKFDQTESQPTSTVLAAVSLNSSTASSSHQCPGKLTAARFPCDYCNRAHPVGVCWKQSLDQLQAQNRPNLRALTQNLSMTVIVPHLNRPAPSESYEVFYGLITQSLAAALIHASPKSSSFKEVIHVDSGCSVHISCMRSYFNDESFEQLTTPFLSKLETVLLPMRLIEEPFYSSHFDKTSPPLSFSFPTFSSARSRQPPCFHPSNFYCFKMKEMLGGPESHIARSDTDRVVALCPLSPVTNLY